MIQPQLPRRPVGHVQRIEALELAWDAHEAATAGELEWFTGGPLSADDQQKQLRTYTQYLRRYTAEFWTDIQDVDAANRYAFLNQLKGHYLLGKQIASQAVAEFDSSRHSVNVVFAVDFRADLRNVDPKDFIETQPWAVAYEDLLRHGLSDEVEGYIFQPLDSGDVALYRPGEFISEVVHRAGGSAPADLLDRKRIVNCLLSHATTDDASGNAFDIGAAWKRATDLLEYMPSWLPDAIVEGGRQRDVPIDADWLTYVASTLVRGNRSDQGLL